MGTLKDLQNKQVSNVIFVGLLLVLAASVAFWWQSTGDGKPAAGLTPKQHALVQANAVSLCTLIPNFTGTISCEDFEQQPNVAGHSVWTNADNVSVVRMDLITTANLSVSEPIESNAWFDTILPEIKSSGRQDWAEPKGAWSKAVITVKNGDQELLFEDNGIVVIMQSNVLDRDTLLRLADQALRTLRKAKPAISSADAATPK